MHRQLFAWLSLLFNFVIFGSLGFGLLLWLLFSYYSVDLPTVEEIENYNPATLSRVYDESGNILGIFGEKNRIYTPSIDIPPLVKQAFISAEDKNLLGAI